MRVTASEFGKNLFRLVDRASRGDPVQVTYRGVVLDVTKTTPADSRIARAKKHSVLSVAPRRWTPATPANWPISRPTGQKRRASCAAADLPRDAYANLLDSDASLIPPWFYRVSVCSARREF